MIHRTLTHFLFLPILTQTLLVLLDGVVHLDRDAFLARAFFLYSQCQVATLLPVKNIVAAGLAVGGHGSFHGVCDFELGSALLAGSAVVCGEAFPTEGMEAVLVLLKDGADLEARVTHLLLCLGEHFPHGVVHVFQPKKHDQLIH